MMSFPRRENLTLNVRNAVVLARFRRISWEPEDSGVRPAVDACLFLQDLAHGDGEHLGASGRARAVVEVVKTRSLVAFATVVFCATVVRPQKSTGPAP
jgi:hypothetical protein